MLRKKSFLLLCTLLILTSAVNAALQRVGPVDPNNGGYPAWYQDTTGLTFEFCQPQNQVELSGGWCFILPANLPTGAVPEVPFSNYSNEHFYWAATGKSKFTAGGQTGTALFVMSVEASFATPLVIPGDQNTFGRLRIRITNLPFSGTYTVYHPYGGGPGTIWEFPNQVAGSSLRFTQDVGFACPKGQFDCALATPIGPFLLPSATTGGAELPPIPGPVPGKSYIGDPLLLYKVTGSPLGQNYVQIVGPVDPATGQPFTLTIFDFSMVGRVMTAAIPDQVNVDRATYSQPVAGSATTKQLDVFAEAYGATQGRLPGGLPTATTTPIMGYYETDCTQDPVTGALSAPVGFTQITMHNNGSDYWGQSQPFTIPLAPNPANVLLAAPACSSPNGCVCVEDSNARNAAGQVLPVFFQIGLTDDVSVTQARYDPAGATAAGTLTVLASSSDQVAPTILTLAGYGPLTIDPVTHIGSIVVTPLAAPPEEVTVLSSNGGSTKLEVTTTINSTVSPTIPVAVNDVVTMLEDCQAADAVLLAQPHTACAAPQTILPLVNDTLGAGPLVLGAADFITITAGPTLGSISGCLTYPCTLAPGTSTILYTPGLDKNGTDTISYMATVATIASNLASITINITPVNDFPSAVNDSSTAVVGGVNSMNVLANDSDPDSPPPAVSDLANAANVVGPAALGLVTCPGALTVGAGGVVCFNPTLAGTYTFTYQAQDKAGALSAIASATVVANIAEVITIAKANYTIRQLRWVVSGTDNVHSGQTLTITYNNGTFTGGTPAAGFVIGTVVVDAVGNWLFDFRPATGRLNPSDATAFSVKPTQIRVTSPIGAPAGAFSLANIGVK